MFRHQKKKVLIDDLIPSGEEPWVYESTEVVSFVIEKQNSVGDDSQDNVHAPTDLTYLVTNDYDVDVSVQIIGGIYNNVTEEWDFVCDIGDPVTVEDGECEVINVFPANPYCQDYAVELTWASLGQGEDGCTVTAIWVVDQ